MARQNRVKPSDEIVATPEWGTVMGNRGLLHDGEGRVVRQWREKRWIACLLAFKGRRRQLMSPGLYKARSKVRQRMGDYELVAAEYARHRRVHPGVFRSLIETAELSPRSEVLEVGCGTGNYAVALAAATGCRCQGIDPSEKMLAAAGEFPDGVHLRAGRAERLDFPDETFDLVFSVDVIHHVGDRPAYFREAFRVLRGGGRICTVTDSEEIIRSRRPLAEYFPETVEADLPRYAATAYLRRWNEQAGFGGMAEVVVEIAFPITDLSAYREKAYSCLHLIPADAHGQGLERMERDLTHGPLQGNSRYLLLWATKEDRPPV